MSGSDDVTAPGVVVAESSDVVVSGEDTTALVGDNLLANLHV